MTLGRRFARTISALGVMSLLVIGCSVGDDAGVTFAKLTSDKAEKLRSLERPGLKIDNVQDQVDSSTTPYKGTMSFNKVLEVDATKFGGGTVRAVLGWKAHYVYRDRRWAFKSAEREVEDAGGRRSWQEPDKTGAVPGDRDIYEILSQ